MKKLLFVFIFFCFGIKAQETKWLRDIKQSKLNTAYNAYFQSAYGIYDKVPKGILESIAFTQTRIRHINPKFEQPSCIGIPLPTGVMGLFEDGKGYFRSNFKLVERYSGYSANELRNDPQIQILAYAKTYQKLLEEMNIQSNQIQDHIPVLIALSELPVASLLEDFAMDSYLYAVLATWNHPEFAKEMLYDAPNISLEAIFGSNYYILSAGHVYASEEKISAGQHIYNPYLSATNKTSSTDYPPAIWDPTTCNYSSRNGTPITHYAIHTVQGSYAGCISWFKNCTAKASAHYVIRSSDGQVTQMVSEANMAWHVKSENPYTIGTEHEGYVNDPAWYTNAMYTSSAALAKDIINSGYGISGLRTYDKPASSVVTATGACIKIKGHQHYPNQTHTDPGINWNWAYFYTLVNDNPSITNFTNASGTITDPGGNPGNYGNDVRQCYLIAPPGATQITLNFSVFNLENNYDFLWVFDGDNPNASLIGKYTGTTLPPTLTANSGKMFLDFRTDCATTAEGFVASYTANVPASPPTTSIEPISGFITSNFTATFTDNDYNAVTERYYLPAYHNGTKWTANISNGFYYDEFVNLTGWNTYSGTWSIISNQLNQSDETADNSNLYLSCPQGSPSTYLYHFTMKITGSGANRRAGLHFFCDNANQANRGNSYFVFFRVDQSKVQIYETINDVFYLRNDIAKPVPAGVTHDIKITYNPNTGTIKVFMNDEFVGQWTDTTPLTSGNHISFRTGASNTTFDDLRVYKSRAGQILTIGVGSSSSNDFLSSNISPTQPSGRIFSIVKNGAELWSTTAERYFDIDFTAPTTIATVNDGTGSDIATTNSGTQLSANWTSSNDPNSGLKRYEYAIGTTPGGTNIVNWTNNGTATSVTKTGLNLTVGTTYYFSVRAINNADLVSAVTSSNGQTYVTSSCGYDAFEVNNSSTTAYLTSTGTKRQALICPTGDEDWFKFSNTSAAKHIRVSLSTLPADYDMELYNSSGTYISGSYNGGTNNEVIIYNNAPVGTYYVRIYGYNGSFHASSKYTFIAQRKSTVWTSKNDNDSELELSESSVSLNIYPNPTRNFLFGEYISIESGIATTKIYNLQGQLVQIQNKEVSEGMNLLDWKLEGLASGMYFLEIRTENSEPIRTKFMITD